MAYIKKKWMEAASEVVIENGEYRDVLGYTVLWNGKRYRHMDCTAELVKMVAKDMQELGFV